MTRTESGELGEYRQLQQVSDRCDRAWVKGWQDQDPLYPKKLNDVECGCRCFLDPSAYANPYLNLNEVIADDLRSFEDLPEQNPPTRFGALHSPQQIWQQPDRKVSQ